jgi:Fe-S cluster assembly protein SufD
VSALLDSLASGFAGDAVRKAALDAALRDGLPGPRSEAWKYTPLRALDRRVFEPAANSDAASVDPALFADIPAPRIVFVNGRVDRALSSFDDLPDGIALVSLADELANGSGRETNFLARRFERTDEVFARLNAALARDGAMLRVEEGVRVERPVHLVFVGAPAASDLAWHARNLIELHRGAALTVVEHHLAAGDHANLGNTLTHAHLAACANLHHARIQDETARATSFLRTDAVLARDATYRRVDLELGAALSRHELNVRLEGEGARFDGNGVLLADGKRHLDTRLRIEHIARNTACDLLWRGLAADRAQAAFHGGIAIRAGADGSDERLSNKNLLLSEGAEIDAQPVLEIHADEVKAAHGAAVGRLDETALFYLRSRGLPVADARRLLTAAFCRETLALFMNDAATMAALEHALNVALARLEIA